MKLKYLIIMITLLTACSPNNTQVAENTVSADISTESAVSETAKEKTIKYKLFYDYDIHKYGLEDTNGNVIKEAVFDEGEDYFLYNEEDIIPVEYNRKWGYINTTGDFAIEPIYDWAELFDYDGTAEIELNGKYGRIYTSGEYAIEPIYDRVKGFGEYDITAVKKDGKWGYINKDGEYVIESVYEDANAFFEDLASVCIDGKWGYIDTEGNVKIDFQFDRAGSFYYSDVAIVNINGFDGLIDVNGDYVAEPVYYTIADFDPDGYARADKPVENYTDYQGHNWISGYIDSKGNWYDTANGRRP